MVSRPPSALSKCSLHRAVVEAGLKPIGPEVIDIDEVVQRLVRTGYLDPSLFSLATRRRMSEDSRRRIKVVIRFIPKMFNLSKEPILKKISLFL